MTDTVTRPNDSGTLPQPFEQSGVKLIEWGFYLALSSELAAERLRREKAEAEAAYWKNRFDDFLAAIGRHADGITSAIVKFTASERQKEAE